jgi:DNA-binding protein Fis
MLRHTAGNRRKAAHLLGISRSTLLNKVRKYGLDS